jgi:gliding motility-associated lipoprotein GldH
MHSGRRLIIFAKTFLLKHPVHLLVLMFFSALLSCTSLGTFEKNIAIPNHTWNSSFKPEISFEIQDTTSRYNLYVVIRHFDAYRYNNIWLNVDMQFPGDTIRRQSLDLRLATDDRGWLGSGMDDVFEHRVLITKEPQYLRKQGIYRFRLEHLMREDPLDYVMNIGIRVEKEL